MTSRIPFYQARARGPSPALDGTEFCEFDCPRCGIDFDVDLLPDGTTPKPGHHHECGCGWTGPLDFENTRWSRIVNGWWCDLSPEDFKP